MREEDAGIFQRASFSPTAEPASRLGSPAARGDTSSREGYRYHFSPLPPKKPDGSRRWSPVKRSGRGWSQFTPLDAQSRGNSGRELASQPKWRHPFNPDFTPQRFWNILEEFRQPYGHGPADSPVAPASLPHIVPKLNLSFLPNAAPRGVGRPGGDEGGEGQHGHMPVTRNMPVLRKARRGTPREQQNLQRAGQRSPRAHRLILAATRGPLDLPEHDLPEEEANLGGLITSTHGRRLSLAATDKELMGLQHRKLGIKPLGIKWDLRGLLHSEDRTLQTAQVAAGVMANQNLQDLDVRGNGLDGACGSILAAALVSHSQIQTICGLPVREIQSNRIGGIILKPNKNTNAPFGPAEMVVLGSFMIDGCCIAKLDLKGIDIGPEGFFTLGYGIRTHTCLTHLNLSRTGMRSENFDDIAPGLHQCTHLSELHLGTNFLEVQAMHALEKLMSHRLRFLRVLDVQNNLLGQSGAIVLGKAVHDHLTDLDISNNQIGAQGCENFLRCLTLNGNRTEMMRHLKLSFNGINLTVVGALKTALLQMRDLTSLKLHSEIPVADVRSKPELMVSGMGFGDVEGVIIAELLKENVNLRKLDLRGNELGTSAIRDLSTVLVQLARLNELNNIALESDTKPDAIKKILGDSMRVNRSTTPAATKGKRFTFLSSFKSTDVDRLKEIAAAEVRQKEDKDNYHNIFRDWKQQGLRPETAAVMTDSDDQEDIEPKFPERFPGVGFYKVGRNPHLRQKARVRAGSTQAHIVPSRLSARTPSTRPFGARLRGINANLPNEVTCSNSPDGEHSYAAAETKANGKRPRTRSKLAALSIDVSSEAPKPDPSPALEGESSTLPSQATLEEGLPSVHEQNDAQHIRLPTKNRSFRKRLAKVRIFGLLGAQGPVQDPVSLAASANVLAHNRTCCCAGSRMGPSGTKKLADELSTVPARLASIDLSLCNLTGLDEDARGEVDQSGFKALCAVLRRNKGILSLNLAWNRLGSNVMPFLRTVLQANHALLNLDLYKNDLQEDGMKILAQCLQHMPYLRELGLRYNRIGPDGAENLAEVLHHMSHLASLDVAGNAFGHSGLKILAPALAHASQLTRVHLQENEGGVRGNCVLAEYIMHCANKLSELNGISMSDLIEQNEEHLQTGFENYEMLYLAHGFTQVVEEFASIKFWRMHSALSPFLQDLNLADCRLTEFPEAVFSLTSMKALNLSSNMLTKIPVSKICDHTSLTELSCHGNNALINPPTEIADQGGRAVMLYLKELINSGVKDDEVALIAIGAASVGKSSCLSCLVTGGDRHLAKTKIVSNESEFEDGTPLFFGEPLFDHALLNEGEFCDDLRRLHISDRDHSYLTGQGGTAVANTMYWRAADTLQFVIHDLPGHSFYSATNRIFMKRRAVYLLVWCVRQYPSDEAMARGMVSVCRELTSSMDFIQSLHPGAHCVTVATHTDVADSAMVAEQAKRVFKAIKEKLESMRAQSSNGVCLRILHDGNSSLISCKKGDGIQMLRKELISFTLSNEAFGALCPRGFLRLRNGLRLVRNRSTLLSWRDYKRLASLCGVAGEALPVASRMLHDRGYLIFAGSDPSVYRTQHRVRLKTIVEMHQRMGTSLKEVQKSQHESGIAPEIGDGENEDALICISTQWLIRVLRGLFNPDIELLIDMFSGEIDAQHANLALLHSTFNFLTRGILERKLVYYLWPCLDVPKYKRFWSAYADHGIGPLNAHEGQLVREDCDYDYLLDVLEHFHILSKLTDTTYWVPCMQMGILPTGLIADARVFKPIRTGLGHQVRFNFLPPDFFSVMVTLCSKIKDRWRNRKVDKIDYCSQAAALYLMGDKVQLWVQQAARSPYCSIRFNSTSLELAKAIFSKLDEMESLYPGIVRLDREEIDPFSEYKEVPNIFFSYSLHSVPHVEILSQEVQKYSSRPRIKSEQVAQFSKILETISVSGRDTIRRRHVQTIGKLRAIASENGILSQDKLGKLGFSDSDAARIYNSLATSSFDGQIVVMCLDALYSDSSESDWHSVQKHAQNGSQVILVLLPGCQVHANMPVKPISIIDLRSADWNQQGRELLFSYEARMRLKSKFEPLVHKLLSNWRGLPPSVKDFAAPPVSCRECLIDGELERERFDFDEHLCTHYDFIMRHLKTGQTLPDEPPVYCHNHHLVHMEDILCAPTEVTATACLTCMEQGKSLPHCFSRHSCLDLMHGKKTFPSPDGHGRGEPTGGKQNGLYFACPQCSSDQLDLVDVVQADAFVSYGKKKIRCTSCGKGNVTYSHAPTVSQPRKQRQRALSPQTIPADGQKESSKAVSHSKSPRISPDPADRLNRTFSANASPASGAKEIFCCQDCNLKFGEENLDGMVQRVRNAVGVLEEQLNIVVVKPSIMYSLNEMIHAGGPMALKAARSAKIFIAFIDNDYAKSHACMSEFAAAVSASRRIIPVILPGYVSTGGNWYPADAKYKRSDGIHMVAPFSVLKHFSPISVPYGDNEARGADSPLTRALLAAACSNLYGGVSQEQRVRNLYDDWRQNRAALCSSMLGKWATLEQDEIDRKIARLWRRHGSYLNGIEKMRRQLANAGIKTTDLDINLALKETSVTLKTMGSNEFRHFMWNLISNITTKVLDQARQAA